MQSPSWWCWAALDYENGHSGEGPIMPRSHQPFHSVLVVKLLGIMLRNRCWPATFHTITDRDADRWCQKWLVWLALDTSHFGHNSSASLAVIVWKMVDQHLVLNIIPSNFTTWTGHKVWCDWGLRGWSRRPLLAPSVSISGCDSTKSGGPTSVFRHDPYQFHCWNQTESLVWSGHRGLITLASSNTIRWHL